MTAVGFLLRSNAVQNPKRYPEMTIRILENIRTVNRSIDSYLKQLYKKRYSNVRPFMF
jgi:hypothetical protein